jgi:hypothetical protein
MYFVICHFWGPSTVSFAASASMKDPSSIVSWQGIHSTRPIRLKITRNTFRLGFFLFVFVFDWTPWSASPIPCKRSAAQDVDFTAVPQPMVFAHSVTRRPSRRNSSFHPPQVWVPLGILRRPKPQSTTSRLHQFRIFPSRWVEDSVFAFWKVRHGRGGQKKIYWNASWRG